MTRGPLLLLVLLGALALPAASASATTLPSEFGASCPTESADGSYGGVRICSGTVPSFDGAKLDVDLTQPAPGPGSHPLIIMLHGFGGDKHDWESRTDEGDGADKHHWNNHWFATHGYYVLSYTARGFGDDGPKKDEPPTPYDPSGSEDPAHRGFIQLKSRDYEIRDTQWLAALIAATYPDVDPNRIAVTGGSYGGIESWVQASQATWTFPHEWDPTLPVLNLQVSVPKYPSTDLAYSLAPNGHGGGPGLNDLYESSQGRPDSDEGLGNPIGAPKESYINGLYALGTEKGIFEQGSSQDAPFPCTYGNCEGPHPLTAWKARTDAGDPTPEADPLIHGIRRGLTEFRGAYYQDEGWRRQVGSRKVAVFSIQGWTDDLFPSVESFRMFKYLKRLDPRWPVQVSVADVGHSRAQNPPKTWQRLNADAFQWLQSNIDGPRLLRLPYPPGSTQGDAAAADPNGPATDAIAGSAVQPGETCRHSDGPAVGGYTQYSQPLGRDETFVGIAHVRVPYVWTGGGTGMLAARLFDAPPDGGKELLITRGVYRFENDPLTGEIRLPLYGNHWRLKRGHRIRLDLTQVDSPTYRASNIPSQFTFPRGVTLVLPTR
jgi:pimeloyl-ACP methyl ester carboxylesterase